MKEICVVHLVRALNGIEPFRRFLESYRINQGGIEHDLLIVFKGFNQSQITKRYRELLSPFNYAWIEISDEGLDITVYFSVIKYYSHQFRNFCFLNSYSEILDSDWLKKLYINLCKPDVGLVGATGSWNSNRSNAYLWFCSELKRIRNITERKPLSSGVLVASDKVMPRGKRVINNIWSHLQYLIYFNSFPNFHIRTNAFMVSGELMQNIICNPVKTKMHAYKFESGKIGLTQQVLNMKKKVLVVGKDGVGYDKESWHLSKTFWGFDQENLLVADNQTRDYQEGSSERREYLSAIAWGK